MEKTIRTILDQAQNNNIRHGEHLKALADLYAKCNQQSFHDEFLRCIASIITSPSNSTFVGHALQFISSFLTLEIGSSTNNNESQNNDSMQSDLFHPILPRVIQFFDEHKNHPNDYVRANICVLIGQTLEKMDENAELDGDLFELLVNICLDRMNDRSYQVRAQAAKASGRLQNTKDIDDLITKRLIWLMDHDSHPLVRKESLRSIAITRTNLTHFLRRLTDTNATVRLCAYNVFAQKVQTLKVLPTKERCNIVRMGMDDPEEPVVRAFVECVVHTWIDKLPVPPGMDLAGQPDAHKTITGFLKMIDVMNIGEQTGRILKMLFDDNLTKHYEHFKGTFINDKRLIGVEQLDCESAFFWQHLVEYLSRNDEYNEKLEAILPELVDLVDVLYDLIGSYHDDSSTDPSVAVEVNFVVDCVLHVMVHCKFDDLAGRYRVETLCRDMLFMKEIEPTTYKMIMNIMKKIEPKFEHRQRKTIEMLADLEKREYRRTAHILADRKSEHEIIALRERQSALQDSLHRIRDHDIASQNIDERVRLEKDLTAVKERLSHYDHTIISTQSQSHMSSINSAGDPSPVDHRNCMLVKRLTILCELLSTTMPNKILPLSFVTYARDLAVSSLMSLDMLVRRDAVRALGLLAVYDKHLMMENLELINKVVENDASLVVIEGLNALGDMFIRHNGLNMMKNMNNSRQVIQSIEQGFNLIAQMIDSRILNVRQTALTNMIKLFFVGQVNSGEAFSKLIVAWYDRLTDVGVGGLLTTFFPAYADKFWQTDKYLFNALQPSIEGLLKNDVTKQEPTFVADAIKLFLQLHQIRERAVINHLMENAPTSTADTQNVDLNDPNTTNLDLTIHAHLNSSIVSINKQALDKETVEKQKHEARLKYHFYVARTILTQLKSSTNDDLIRSLITTLNLIDITTDDWTIIKNLRKKSKKVNKDLMVNKRKTNLKLFIKKLSNRIELLRGFDDDNDTTLNESTLTDSSQLNATVISAVPAHVINANSTTPGSPLMDKAFRGLGKKKRIVKDSLLSQNSTSSFVAPPPPPPPPPPAAAARSPPLPSAAPRNAKNTKKNFVTPVQKVTVDNDSSSCSSPSSGSDNEDPRSDVENEDPQQQSIPSVNKRVHADATSTESLSPPRDSVTNSTRMMLRSSARRQQQTSQQIPVSTPSFRQQRKHRRIDLDITPLNITNNKKLPPTQSSTPDISK